MDGARLKAPYRFEFRVRGPKILAGDPVGSGQRPILIQPRDTFRLVVSQLVDPLLVVRWGFIETERSCTVGRRVTRPHPHSFAMPDG